MNGASIAPKRISEIIDRLDVMREELLMLQGSLEMFETVEKISRSDDSWREIAITLIDPASWAL